MSILKDGDFVVVQTRWETAVRQIIKVSASIYYYDDGYYNKQRRGRQDEIMFAGGEYDAKLLCERLKSSEAKYQDDCNKAILRREKRDAAFVELAKAPVKSRVDREGGWNAERGIIPDPVGAPPAGDK